MMWYDWIAAWLAIGANVAVLVVPPKCAEIREFFGAVDRSTFVLCCLFAVLLWPVALWTHRHG